MARSPNILLLMTDQMRHDAMGCAGNFRIRTPHLDRMASQGVRYRSAYSPSPECVPARASFTFGQDVWETGCTCNGENMPLDRLETMMGALGRAGYTTHGIGKYHFTPSRVGYDLHGFGSRESSEEITSDPERDDYLQFLWFHGGKHITDPHGVRGDMYYVPQPAQMSAELHPTQWVGDRACAYLEERAKTTAPWYLYASFIHPHPPFAPPAPWHKLYRDVDMPPPHLPPDYESLQIHINHLQNRYKRRDQGMDQRLLQVMRAYYFACVSFIDFQVGRILDALEASGQAENTLVLFTSDHGELLGDYGSFGKRSYHDAASRIPLIARLPGEFSGGEVRDDPVSLIDLTATCLDVANAKYATHTGSGETLRHSGEERAHQYAYTQYARGANAVYTAVEQGLKYVYSAPDNRALLFDRKNDPGETRDLFGSSAADSRVVAEGESLGARLRQHLAQTGGGADALDGDQWRQYPAPKPFAGPDDGLIFQDHPWADQAIPGYTI